MKRYFTVTDILIAVVVFAMCLCGMLVFARGNVNSGKSIVIETDGKVYGKYNMDTLAEPKEITIETKYGENVLRIDSEGADMIFSDCEMQIDVRHRKISNPGEIIVCAPHKLTVYIEGKNEYDGISS